MYRQTEFTNSVERLKHELYKHAFRKPEFQAHACVSIADYGATLPDFVRINNTIAAQHVLLVEIANAVANHFIHGEQMVARVEASGSDLLFVRVIVELPKLEP